MKIAEFCTVIQGAIYSINLGTVPNRIYVQRSVRENSGMCFVSEQLWIPDISKPSKVSITPYHSVGQ